MYIFYAFPFAQLCDPKDGQVRKEYRQFFNDLKEIANKNRHTYFLAHEREDWGAEFKGPEECVPNDYEGVVKSDLMIVVPGDPISGGVQVEMGWASANKKNMHIFCHQNIVGRIGPAPKTVTVDWITIKHWMAMTLQILLTINFSHISKNLKRKNPIL